jgi:hypothetical protein
VALITEKTRTGEDGREVHLGDHRLLQRVIRDDIKNYIDRRASDTVNQK